VTHRNSAERSTSLLRGKLEHLTSRSGGDLQQNVECDDAYGNPRVSSDCIIFVTIRTAGVVYLKRENFAHDGCGYTWSINILPRLSEVVHSWLHHKMFHNRLFHSIQEHMGNNRSFFLFKSFLFIYFTVSNNENLKNISNSMTFTGEHRNETTENIKMCMSNVTLIGDWGLLKRLPILFQRLIF